MKYNTCLTYFLNQDFNTLTYCRTEWVSFTTHAHEEVLTRLKSKLVDWLASNCSASNGAHGGLCVANDQRWYVQ